MEPQEAAQLHYAAQRLRDLGAHLLAVERDTKSLLPQVTALIAGAAGKEDKQMEEALRFASKNAGRAGDTALTAAKQIQQLAGQVK